MSTRTISDVFQGVSGAPPSGARVDISLAGPVLKTGVSVLAVASVALTVGNGINASTGAWSASIIDSDTTGQLVRVRESINGAPVRSHDYEIPAGATTLNLATLTPAAARSASTPFLTSDNHREDVNSEVWGHDNATTVTAGFLSAADKAKLDSVGLSAISGTYTQQGTGAVGRAVSAKLDEVVSVKDFGAAGDGVTDDTGAIVAALATLTDGGSLYFPKGTYKVLRGDGSLLADNIVADNVTIYGEGAASVIVGYKADGNHAGSNGNEFYNIFQATNRTNIVIRDLAIEGTCALLAAFTCTNVRVEGIYDNGLIPNASKYLRDKTIYTKSCENVTVDRCFFDNAYFAVYLSGTSAARTTKATVSNCVFSQSATAGNFTAAFPVGVYLVYADEVLVANCTFEDIYSSVDGGSTGTGLGYGVYEGDGECTSIQVIGNMFRWTAKGLKNACGIYLNEAIDAIVADNYFLGDATANVTTAILIDAKVTGVTRLVEGNNIRLKNGGYGIHCNGSGSSSGTNTGHFRIAQNVIAGGTNAIRVDGFGNIVFDIEGNAALEQTSSQLSMIGVSTTPLKAPRIVNNRLTKGQGRAISLGGYVVGAQIIGNTILDGNLGNTAGDNGAAILFSSNSWGSVILGNTIGNTAHGGGLFTYGVQNSDNASARIFKDVAGNNNFIGLTDGSQFGRFWTSAPTNGIFDVNKGDFYLNTSLAAGGVPGWYCVRVATPTLDADASSASTTVTVSSTSGLAANDVVLLCKDSDPYSADYYDTAKWHVDTVASITDATHFVLTTGIPAGDGTYVAGTAFVKIVRIKAAAAVAS